MYSKVLKIYFFCCISLFTIITSFGQIDSLENNNNGFSSMNIVPIAPVEKSEFIDPRNIDETDFQKAIENLLKKLSAQEERDNLKNKGIMTKVQMRKELFEEEEEKKLNEEINDVYAIIDQNLGGFVSNSETITIVCRDFQYPDGDEVAIYVNGVAVIPSVLLTRQWTQFTLPLEVGLNVISFKALNQGFSGPNTAAFIIVDDKAEIISSNEWNLATGAKATLSIAKIE